MWEAFRLLGTGLHTLEDLLAHSKSPAPLRVQNSADYHFSGNWCELTLRKMGHRQVFCHVGDRVTVQTPSGPAPPLVTGTFGGADFLHSLLGEATEYGSIIIVLEPEPHPHYLSSHLSEASVIDLTQKMSAAKLQSAGGDSPIKKIQDILGRLPSNREKDERMGSVNDFNSKRKGFNLDPGTVAPEQVRQQLWAILKWRDGLMKDVARMIENIPGLEDLLEQLTNALNACKSFSRARMRFTNSEQRRGIFADVFTVLEPWLTPILQQSTGTLQEGSAAVINSADQYEVST